mgnify:CR=1 FL=1
MTQAKDLARTSGTSPPVDEPLASRIVDFLEQHPTGVTEAQILDAVEGRRQRKVAMIRILVASGRATKSGRGGKRDPFRYSATAIVPASVVVAANHEHRPSVVGAPLCNTHLGHESPRMNAEDLEAVVAAVQMLIGFRDRKRKLDAQQIKSNPMSLEDSDQVE